MPSIIPAESPLTSTRPVHAGPHHRGNGRRDRQKWGVLPGEGSSWGLVLALSSTRNASTHVSLVAPACADYFALALLDPGSLFCPPRCFVQVLWLVL